MFSKPIFCSKIAQKGKTIAQKVPIEHNRDRPSRESVKFLFVRAQKKGDALEVRVIIGKYRTIQKYSRDRRHKEEKRRLALELYYHLVFYERALWKAGSTPEWMDTYALAYDYSRHTLISLWSTVAEESEKSVVVLSMDWRLKREGKFYSKD